MAWNLQSVACENAKMVVQSFAQMLTGISKDERMSLACRLQILSTLGEHIESLRNGLDGGMETNCACRLREYLGHEEERERSGIEIESEA